MMDVDLAAEMHRERMAFAQVRVQAAGHSGPSRVLRARLRPAKAQVSAESRHQWHLKPRLGHPKPIRLGSVVLDCRDAEELGEFYRSLLGGHLGSLSPAWTDLKVGRQLLSFHGIADYQYPSWPTGHPEYVRLDLAVREFSEPHRLVTSLGAVPLDPMEPPPVERAGDHRIYADPAGHPFSLSLL